MYIFPFGQVILYTTLNDIIEFPFFVQKFWRYIEAHGNFSENNTRSIDLEFVTIIQKIELGDKDDDAVTEAVISLAKYKVQGTGWRQGRVIRNIVDTAHFARSHHSRLIQLADIFVYLLQFMHGPTEGSAARRAFRAYLREETGLGSMCQSRVWPIQPFWYR